MALDWPFLRVCSNALTNHARVAVSVSIPICASNTFPPTEMRRSHYRATRPRTCAFRLHTSGQSCSRIGGIVPCDTVRRFITQLVAVQDHAKFGVHSSPCLSLRALAPTVKARPCWTSFRNARCDKMGLSWRMRTAMTLIRVNETESGGEFLILNLQTITRVECRNFGQG
jgi:hypothetical protein